MNSEPITVPYNAARDAFYEALQAAKLDLDTFGNIGQAATNWMESVRSEAVQETLNVYRKNNVSIPFETTYPADKKKIA